MSLLRRIELLRDRDLTLGTFAETLARVHEAAPLVEEHGDRLRLDYLEAASTVARWSGALRQRVGTGDCVVNFMVNG